MANIIYLNDLPLLRLSQCRTGCRVLSSILVVFFFFSCTTALKKEDISKAEAHFTIGLSAVSDGELSKAYIKFQKAIKLNPKHKESLNYLGYISARFQKFDDAELYYKRAISVDQNYSDAMNNLGVLYLETEDWDDAIKYFEMALSNPIYSTPERAYSNLGFAFLKKEEYQSAQDAIDNALTRDPDYLFAMYAQGLLFTKLHDDDSAIKEFLKVISVMPDYVEAHWELANAYVRTGKHDKAITHFKVVADKGSEEIADEALEYLKLLKR